MSMRFYRRVRLGKGATLNVGKTGLSLSLGVRGAHMTFGGVGGTRATVGIPGTGLFWTHNFTAAEKRKARYEAKQQRDAAHEAARQQRAFERERKRQERERSLERAVKEKQMQLAALKSEFDEYNAYIASLSSFHKIDMLYGDQAQAEFKNRCEPRVYTTERFPFEDSAENMPLYLYSKGSEAVPKGGQVECILRANNEEFRKITQNFSHLKTVAKLKEKIEKESDKLIIPGIIFVIGCILIFFFKQVAVALMAVALIAAAVVKKKYGIGKAEKTIKSILKYLGLKKKKFESHLQAIESSVTHELDFYKDIKKELDSIKFISKALASQWTDDEAAGLAFAKEAFQTFITSQEVDDWQTYEKKQRLNAIIEMYGQDFYNWAILQTHLVCLNQMAHIDGMLTLPGFQKMEGSNDMKRAVLWRQFLGDALLERFNDSDKIQQEYESFAGLRESFEIWIHPEQHKNDWLNNEAMRVELLQKAGSHDLEAISALCEALLPLPIDTSPPSWIDASSLHEYEVAYHVETPEEGWLLIELPDVAIIPEYSAQLSPGGNSLTYPAMTERNRFSLYDKCATSFSLLHAQLLYLTFPFFKKIWIEAYTKAIDSATGMPRRKNIVQGYIDTEDFIKFNFNNTDPVEAIKALKVNFFPFSTKQFVEPTWADDDGRIIWASREDDVPDGLLPF